MHWGRNRPHLPTTLQRPDSPPGWDEINPTHLGRATGSKHSASCQGINRSSSSRFDHGYDCLFLAKIMTVGHVQEKASAPRLSHFGGAGVNDCGVSLCLTDYYYHFDLVSSTDPTPSVLLVTNRGFPEHKTRSSRKGRSLRPGLSLGASQ